MALIAGVVGVTALLWGWTSTDNSEQQREIERLRKTVNKLLIIIFGLLVILGSIISYNIYINSFMNNIEDALDEMKTINATLNVANKYLENNEEYNMFDIKYAQLPQFQIDFINILQENNISDIKELRSFDNKELDEIWQKTANRMYERFYNILKETSPPFCTDKCYNFEELMNNECETDCQCASVRRCIGKKCQGISTYFNDPPCNTKAAQYINLLEKYDLKHIWPILNNNGYNSTAIILSITQQMLKEINIQTADTLKFGNLQKDLEEQKKSIITKILNHPISKFCQENTELLSGLLSLLGTIPIVARYTNIFKKE